MKKYQQLLLAIISVFSFSCLLIYRHEYNKLRYVLEVLNFFGTPGIPTFNSSLCGDGGQIGAYTDNGKARRDFGPLPAWQRISDSLHVYSAYWEKIDDNDEHVRAFVAGTLNLSLHYGCSFWYDERPKIQVGKFRYVNLTLHNEKKIWNNKLNMDRTRPFEFYCNAQVTGRTPFGVSFYVLSTKETFKAFIPIHVLPTTLPQENSTGLCVLPVHISGFHTDDNHQFMTFHKLVGVDMFVYYGSIYSGLIQGNKFAPSQVAVLPWNYPFGNSDGGDDDDVMAVIAENDCKMRATGLVEYVTLLDWNKYLVPHYLLTIGKLLNAFDVTKKNNKFLLPTLLFCLEYSDDIMSNVSTPIIFKKTKYSLPAVNYQVALYKTNMKAGGVLKVRPNMIAVHQYSSCQGYKLSPDSKDHKVVEPAMLKFQDKYYRVQGL